MVKNIFSFPIRLIQKSKEQQIQKELLIEKEERQNAG